ncbi:hypothetical protein D3C75_422590 [compost metagenome]
MIEPFEREHALFRLQGHPGENADGHYITACQLHQADILFKNFRVFQPLLRIIIGSMQHDRGLAADCRGFKTHSSRFILSSSSVLGWDFSLIIFTQYPCPNHG